MLNVNSPKLLGGIKVMRNLIFVFIVSVIFISGCITESRSYSSGYDFSNVDKIAIVAVTGQIDGDMAQNQVADLFAMELLGKGYAPIRLAQVKASTKLMTESQEVPEILQSSYIELGQIFKVPAVLVVDIPYYEDEIFVTTNLINVADGSIIWMSKASGKTGRMAQTAYAQQEDPFLFNPIIFQQTTQQAQNEPTEVETGEKPLSPSELDEIELVVKKICSSIPKKGTAQQTPTARTPRTRTQTSDW